MARNTQGDNGVIALPCPLVGGDLSKLFKLGHRITARPIGVLALPADITAGLLPEKLIVRVRELQRRRTEEYLAAESGGRGAVPQAPMFMYFSCGSPIAWITVGARIMYPSYDGVTVDPDEQAVLRMIRADQQLIRTTLGWLHPQRLREWCTQWR